MNFLFLASYTPRSQAYAQALVRANLKPEQVILYGDPMGGLPGQKKLDKTNIKASVPIPDFSESLKDTCKKGAWNVQEVITSKLNDGIIFDSISYLKPELVVCSLYGKQLAGDKLLSLAPFLHIHCGWLPDYRGSTTIYYSILKESLCGASAILLDKGIDTGKIIVRKKYPMPPKGMDIDYIYDSSIRADLLVKALKSYGKLPLIRQSEKTVGYYVIHPILKHLAYLRIQKQ